VQTGGIIEHGSRLSVTVDSSHPDPSNQEISVTSPEMTRVDLFSYQFPAFPLEGVTFADDAYYSSDNFNYSFYVPELVPDQPLLTFEGESLDGIWSLTISDNNDNAEGAFNNWKLGYGSFRSLSQLVLLPSCPI